MLFLYYLSVTYSITESNNPPKATKFLGTTNPYYELSISLLLNKEPAYVVLTLDSEDSFISFLHI